MILNCQKIYLLSLIFLIGCSKEIDISEFSDDFSQYNPELRIEALILPGDNTAIVRIDRSILINDTDVYNCKDDDFGEISQDSCNALGGTWHGSNGDAIAPCGDWTIADDLGIDAQVGDPTDDDGDCEQCSFWSSEDEYALCLETCTAEDSIGENNGMPDCNEPHVDETDEIIKKIHVNNCSVKMTHGEYECIFEYDENANSFFYDANYKDEEEYSLNNIETPSYGAYVPSALCSDFDWNDLNGEYRFESNCPNYGTIVSDFQIQISSPVVFYNEIDILPVQGEPPFTDIISNCENNECLRSKSTLWNVIDDEYDTLYFARYAINDHIHYSSIAPYFYYQSVQYFYDDDNDRYIYLHGHPDAATEVENIHGNATLMKESIVTDFLEFDNTPIIKNYYYDIFTFSEDYKNYYFFDLLDLSDPVRTNLRKLDNNQQSTIPVMGAFGSMSLERIYFEIIDCLEYDSQQTCENVNFTKSVCQWYDQEKNYGDVNGNDQYDEGENIVPADYLPLCGPIKMPPIN